MWEPGAPARMSVMLRPKAGVVTALLAVVEPVLLKATLMALPETTAVSTTVVLVLVAVA